VAHVSSRALASVSLACAIAFASLTTWVVADESIPGDRRLLVELRDAISDDTDDTMIAVRRSTDTWPVAGAAIVITGLAVAARRRVDALTFALAFGLTVAVNPLLKELVGRGRPDVALDRVSVSRHTFPSGHAVASAALVMGLVLLVPPDRRRLAVIAGGLGLVLVAFSQLALGLHYPSDILGGWLWAATGTGALWAAVSRRHARSDAL
jgi:undecaprenyl-diphosphatase